MRILHLAAGLCAIMVVTLEAAAAQQPLQGVWVTTDGRTARNNPKLRAQGERDWAACKYEVDKIAAAHGPVYWSGVAGAITSSIYESQKIQQFINLARDCMAQKGWVIVPREQAEAMAAQERKPAKRR